ncbi:trichohyalin [Selaginella moellendorffii]|uniref:trichohyalin n=1 Tax=Selaginella moellendorffii TaxID=88036 RepID=UPI000D1C2C41|nr:trichohyalin [Selaginella moellendorffii]|eukprot:XP_024527569.1 trichohyalin [Selaginella moellendorffii]
MARTEQERCGCVTGLWSLFRPKKAHKGDNKVQAQAVSGEAMDAAALKLKELRREENQEKKAKQLKEEDPMKPTKPIKLEQEENNKENQEKKLKKEEQEKKAEQEEEQEKKAEQLNEEEQEKPNEEEKEADQTKELRREVKQEQGHKEQSQLEREEKNQPNQPIKPIKPMKQELEQEEQQRMKPMQQQLEQEEEQTIKPIKQPLEREEDQMKQQKNDKPKQEEQRPKPIRLPAGGRRPGSRPKMVRFSSSAEDILPDGTRRRSETHLSDGRGGYVEFAYLEAFHKANRWLNQRGKTEKKIRSLEEEKYEETEEEDEEKSWSVSALRILIRLTEQLYEELNGKSSDRERIKRARKMMRLQKMLDRIPSERKPWKKLQSGEVVFVKVAKELYDRAGRDFVAEFKRRQRAGVNDECLFCRNHDGEKMIGQDAVSPRDQDDIAARKLTKREDRFPVDGDETGATAASYLVDGDFENGSGLSRNARTAARVKVSGKNSVLVSAGANSKTTRPWVYLKREHEQTVLSTSKKREMKLRAREVGCKDWSTRGQCSDSSIGEANSRESNPEVGAASQISKKRPASTQWIKLGHTLQCLEQGGIYLIGFPVDGDDSGAPAAVRLSMIVARNNRNQCQMAARWQEDDIAEAARDRGFGWLRRL